MILEFVLIILFEGVSSLVVEEFTSKSECEAARSAIVEGYKGVKNQEQDWYILGKQVKRDIITACVLRKSI